MHCEATTVALTETPWYNTFRALTVWCNPCCLVFRWLPLMLHRFFDDACVYDLQPMLETPAAAMNTMHERACLVVFRQVHARLAQCLGGPMA